MQYALGAVTVVSLLMTIAMGIITWRLLREDRQRSAARLSALMAELKRRGITPSALRPATDHAETSPTADALETFDAESDHRRSDANAVTAAELFAPHRAASNYTRGRVTTLGLAGAVLAISLALTIFTGSREAPPAPVTTPVPVELITLTHEQHNGRLAISGTVRNPAHAKDDRRVSVLAVALDDGGAAVATGRGPVDTSILAAGDQASFAISIQTDQARRYRISFLVDDRPVPHVDQRSRPTQALTEAKS